MYDFIINDEKIDFEEIFWRNNRLFITFLNKKKECFNKSLELIDPKGIYQKKVYFNRKKIRSYVFINNNILNFL